MNCIIILLFVLSIFALIFTIKDRKLLEEERKQLEKIIDDGNSLYEQVVNENKKLRYVKHDYKKQLQIVNKANANEVYPEFSGNKILDIILDTKSKEAITKNIKFTLSVDRLINWNIEDGETISLFTNLLDNAIEAANKVSESRYVDVNVSQGVNEIAIRIKNAKTVSEKPLELDMTTTKSDVENHGYGIKIIKEIVYNNKGIIKMFDDVNEFVIEIVL